MSIRPADSEDVARMTALVEAERERYEMWQPLMWQKANDSKQKTLDWFPHLVAASDVLTLVSKTDGAINGFIIAFPQTAPPVYTPGKTYMIDDFCVAEEILWPTVGKKLLIAVLKAAKSNNATQCLSVCPVAHEAKASLLAEVGLEPASTWSAIAL